MKGLKLYNSTVKSFINVGLRQNRSGTSRVVSFSQQPIAVSTSTPSNAVRWECSARSATFSRSRQQSQVPQQPSKQSSFEQGEALGTLTADQICPVGHQPQHQAQNSQQLSKQNFVELDESLGILTLDEICPVGSQAGHQPQHQAQNLQQVSTQSSFEQDESLGILTPDQMCPVGSQPGHQPQHQSQNLQQLSKQNSFELDESLGILTPDQMIDFTLCPDNTTVGRTPSFEDVGLLLLGDFKGDRVEDLLPDHLPSESDGPSSSNYPSSEFPQLPGDADATQKVMTVDHFLVSKSEDLELLGNEAATPDQRRCASNTMCCVSEELSDNVCPAVSKSSDGDFRVGQDISDRTLSPEDLPMDAPFQEVMEEILQKAEVTSESGRDTAGLSGECRIAHAVVRIPQAS